MKRKRRSSYNTSTCSVKTFTARKQSSDYLNPTVTEITIDTWKWNGALWILAALGLITASQVQLKD